MCVGGGGTKMMLLFSYFVKIFHFGNTSYFVDSLKSIWVWNPLE